jgi:hypothetical protein
MKLELWNNKDFWAGMLFLVTGAGAILVARGYPFGTTLRMGPGYFPSILGGILILFGVSVMAMGLRSNEKIQGGWPVRALLVLPLSLVLFGFLVDHLGFIAALVALIFGTAVAGREFRLLEVLLLAVVLTVLAVAVFVWGLGLPFSLIKGL